MYFPRLIILAIALSFLISASLDAQTDRNYFYLHGQLGAVSYHGDLSEVNEDLAMFDFGFSAGIGYVISPVFSLRSEYRIGEYPRTDRPNAAQYLKRHNTGLYAVFNLLPNSSVSPYLIGGASMTFFGTYDKGVQERDGSTYFGPAFGPVFGGGLNFRLSDRFSFFAETKWDIVTDDEAMDELSGDTGFDVMGYISGGLRMNLRPSIRPVRGLFFTGSEDVHVGDEIEFSAMVGERVSEPVRYSWTFGDGRSGEGKNVSHVYMNPGAYEVTVIASNPVSSQSQSMRVNVSRRIVPASIAAVSASTTNPDVGETVRFSVELTGTEPVAVAWDLGDGTTSNQKAVQHAYQTEGEYDVVVRVDNVAVAGERGTDTRRMTITVASPEPVAPVLPALASLPFEFNSSYFGDAEREVLMQNVRIIRDNPDLCVHIKGYTDGAGTDEYNLWLSDRRAQRVKDFYLENGIAERRIHAEGLGIAPEPCPDGRAACRENRRVDSEVVECR
jgi:outer membrane protein OmpA-like peptidoglycan-associated protein